MNSRRLSTFCAVSALALVTACAGPARREARRDENNNVAVAPVPASPSGQYAQMGNVNSIDIVPVASHNQVGGAILGAVIGGVIGNQFGGGMGKALTTGAGAVGGAMAGNALQNRNRRDDEIYRVTVRFDDGSTRSFDYQRVDDLRVGDRVKLEQGELHRV